MMSSTSSIPANISKTTALSTSQITQTKEAAQTSNAASTSAAPPPLEQKKVIDAKTLAISQEGLGELANNLGNYVNNASKALGKTATDSLQDEIGKLVTLTKKKVSADDFTQGKLGLEVRDCFARMADICAKQANQAHASQTKKTLKNFHDVFFELKRHHLSHAAPAIYDDYSKEEAKGMKKDNVGIATRRAGAGLTDAGEQEITVVDPTETIEIKLKRNFGKTTEIDDDLDVMTKEATSGTLGCLGGIGELVKLEGSGKVTVGERYRKSGNYEGHSKILAKDHADDKSLFKSWARRATIAGSASPEARARSEKLQKADKTLNAHTLHARANAPLYLTSEKVAKGAFNHEAIHLAAESLDRLLTGGQAGQGGGGNSLAEIVKAAYPDHVTYARQYAEEHPDEPALVPKNPMDYAPLPSLSSGNIRRGKEKNATSTGTELALKGKVGKSGVLDEALKARKAEDDPSTLDVNEKEELTNPAGISGTFEVNAALMARRAETTLERLKPMHAMITSGYTKDVGGSLRLWDKIENAATDRNGVAANRERTNAKLALYRNVNDKLQEISPAPDDPQLTPEAKLYFGPAIDIPKTFLGTVCAPKEKLGDLLKQLTQECDKLKDVYDGFEQGAGQLHTESASKAPDDLKSEYSGLQKSAAQKILGEVWKDGHPEFRAGDDNHVAALARNGKAQRELIADSYDAISMALGSMGTHLEIIKAKILEDVGKSEKPSPELLDLLKKADKSYATLGKAIEAANVPLPKDQLFRYNTLAWGVVSSSNEYEFQFGVSGGGSFALASLLREQLSGEEVEVVADLQNAALQASVTVGIKYTQQDHPNYSRKGDFLEVSVTGGGGNPLVGPLAEKFMRTLTKLLYKGPDGGFPDTEGPSKVLEAVKHSASAASALESTQECQLTWRYHKYSEVPNSKMDFQFFKIAQKRDENIGVSVSAPTGTVELGLGVKVGQSNLVPVFEYMGSDIGHHIINFPHLDNAVKAADKMKAADEAKKADDPELADEAAQPKDKLSYLKDLLDKDPKEYKASEDYKYLKSQFFSGAGILKVVEKYQEFANWKQNPDTAEPLRDSNFNFFDSEKIQESARGSRHADSVSAGKALKLESPTSLADWPAVPDDVAADLKAAKKEFEALKTDDARADFLLNTDRGRAIFNTYSKIVSHLRERNTVATTNHSYAPFLRKEERSAVTETFVNPLRTAKNFASSLNPLTGGASGNGRKAAEFLESKGLFAEGRQKNAATVAADCRQQGVSEANAAKLSLRWLDSHSIGVADNGFTGPRSFVTAYLQQATGRYDDLHLEKANKYLAALNDDRAARAAGGRQSSPDDLSPEDMRFLASAINKDYGKKDQVHMVTPGADGHVVWTGDAAPADGNNAHASAILHMENDRGESTFAALVHKGDLDFAEYKTRKGAEKQIGHLDNKRIIRDYVANQENDLTGNTIREGKGAVDPKGVLQRFGKTTAATFADVRQPVRKEIRAMTDSALATWIADAEQAGNRQDDVKEGRKEQKKRAEMRGFLTGERPQAPSLADDADALTGIVQAERYARELGLNEQLPPIIEESDPSLADDADALVGIVQAERYAQELEMSQQIDTDTANADSNASKSKDVQQGGSKGMTGAQLRAAMRQYGMQRGGDKEPTATVAGDKLLNKRMSFDPTISRRLVAEPNAAEHTAAPDGKLLNRRMSFDPTSSRRLVTEPNAAKHTATPDGKLLNRRMSFDPSISRRLVAEPNAAERPAILGKKLSLRELFEAASSRRLVTAPNETSQMRLYFADHTAATDNWFENNNFEVVSNSGNRNNCLILSLLQHAAGPAGAQDMDRLTAKANEIREKFIAIHPEVAEGDMLEVFSGGNDAMLNDLTGLIRQEPASEFPHAAELAPLVVHPHADGMPSQDGVNAFTDEQLENLSNRQMIVYGRNGDLHFEAVMKKDD